jgi:transposase
VRRLVRLRDEDDATRSFLLAWSRWRRAHQATARRCHIARRARERAAPHAPAFVPPLARGELTDAEWERVRPLLPPQRPPVGRPRHDHRTVLGGILWVLRTAAPWRELPTRFGHWETAYGRHRLWRKQGLWQRIIDALGPAASLVAPASESGACDVSL